MGPPERGGPSFAKENIMTPKPPAKPPTKDPIDVERSSHPSGADKPSVSPPIPPAPAHVQPPAQAAAPARAAAPAPAAHPEPTPAPKKLVFANLEHSVDAMDAQRVKIAKLEKNLVDAKAELDEMIRLHNLLPK